MSGSHFVDISKESAVCGAIAAGSFDLIPQASLISPEAFVDDKWRLVYNAALELRSTHKIVCAASVSDYVAFSQLDEELQKAVDSTNTLSWRKWGETADTSLALCPSSKPLEYILAELDRLHRKRLGRQIGARLEQGLEEDFSNVISELQELSHQNNGDSLKSLLERKFNFEHPPEKPLPIFTLCNQAIATPGNLVSLYSQAKTGKSAVLSAMMAAIFSPEDPLLDFLGFGAEPNIHGHAVIHFDTEQSRYDADQLIRRALRRAEIHLPPLWLRSYCLTDIDINLRRQLLSAELEAANKECGGIYCVLLDGIGDLAIDLNDIGESNTLLIDLHAQAIKYNCPIVGVLHENPGTNSPDKQRGHLGSQLERKAESNIRLVKDSDGSTIIYTEKSRHANIPRKSGHRFKWNKSQAMHTSTELDPKATINYDNLLHKQFVDELYKENAGGFSWSDLHKRIALVGNLSESGARKRFAKLLKLELIEKNSAGFYLPNLK